MGQTAPCLRSDLTILQQVFRGETSFVVKDHATHRYFRFRQLEVLVMRAFDGRSEPAQIAATLSAAGTRISAQAVEAFARSLDRAGLLERTLAQRATLQMERLRAARRNRTSLFRGELLRMRWSFGNPDAMLERTLPHLRWMFTRRFVVLSAVLFVAQLLALGVRWDEFIAAVTATYSPQNLTVANAVLLWVTCAVVILIHELGHAYTCKYHGGDVREMGFMLIYFQPAFYCNVSDAWSFPRLSARLWVTAAGSWIQMVVASIAALVWIVVAPGTFIGALCVATILVGGMTTILTNMNPLLPLDGYFALSDWLEIPNLRHRAFAHCTWWLKRHALGFELPEPTATARERRVFLIYGALAVVYIGGLFAVLGALAMGWARQAFGVLGVLAVVAIATAMLRDVAMEWGRAGAMAFRARRAGWRRLPGWPRRRRMIAGAFAVLLAGLFVPWTLTSPGRFVVHPVGSHRVTAPAEGIVALVLVSEGSRVEAGAPLAHLVDRALERALMSVARVIDSLAVGETTARAAGNPGEAHRLGALRGAALGRQQALESRVRQLTIRATGNGVVVTARPEELLGRRVKRGDVLLTLASPDSVEARVALTGGGATRVRAGDAVHLISHAGVGFPWRGQVTDVSQGAEAGAPSGGVTEARIRLAAGGWWRVGVTGEASVELSRSTVFGALVWKARQVVRPDFWL